MSPYKFKDMESFIKELPLQIKEGLNLEVYNRKDYGDIKGIVLCGMGGSGIAGDLLKRISNIPFFVFKDYKVPEEYINEDFLYIFVSYSGNTEETIENFEKLKDKKSLVVTSGGNLLRRAKELNIPFINLPEGYPPRCALGWIFSSIFSFLEKYLKFNKRDLIETSKFIEKKVKDYSKEEGKGFDIASKIYKRLLFIYTPDEYFPCALRWKTQINENGKTFCHIDILPEMNHNEIVGLCHPEDLLDSGWAIFIKGPDIHKRNLIRIEETIKLIQDVFVGINTIEPEGKNYLERIFDLIILGDFVSYFIARFYKEDPFEIKRIDLLKERMKEK
ncbi:MAG: bifunctional phosphoglucose/phosphomannose isomerase [candidate division WOR-3 bacterium]